MVKVRVPASTSNLGSGFDTFGLALQLYLTVEMDAIPKGLEIKVSGEGSSDIPKNQENLVYKAAKRVYEVGGKKLPGLRIKESNEIPLLRGLGSSGAAIIAGLVCAAKLFDLNLEKNEIMSIAVQIESHPDNVAAALYGGLTISCISNDQVVLRKVPVDEKLNCVLLIPNYTISTKSAREILPKKTSRKDAIFNIQRSALLTQAFITKNYETLRIAMEDKLHQPFRKHLILGYDKFEKMGYQHGALGVCISGSGSAIAGFAQAEKAVRLQLAWQNLASDLKMAARIIITGFDNNGVVVE